MRKMMERDPGHQNYSAMALTKTPEWKNNKEYQQFPQHD